MRILRLRADGFGPLRGEFAFDPDRLTLVVDDNERGKSSLLAAIAAALYGLERSARAHRTLTPLERWRPWDGGGYRVELEIECGGERLVVQRDFDRGLVEVRDERGRDRTDEFREGKDLHPVGKRLLELDAAEFEKCALLRQGELDQVVPDEEPARRGSTLRARLENVADTRAGDASATRALQALEQAAAAMPCPEVSAHPLRVESAVQRLEALCTSLETDLHALDNDRRQLGEPLEEIAALTTSLAAERAALAGDEARLAAARAGEARSRVADDDAARAERERLAAEARALAAGARLGAAALGDLRTLAGREEEASRRGASLGERLAELSRERAGLEAEREPLARWAAFTEADADRLAAWAAERARLLDELSSARQALAAWRREAAARGLDAAPAVPLDRLTPDEEERLAGHPAQMLAFQPAIDAIGARHREALETQAQARRARARRRVPGWVLLGAGLSGAAAAAWLGADPAAGPPAWFAGLAAASGLALAAGAALLARARGVGRAERTAAERAIAAAETELAAVRREQIARQDAVAGIAARLGLAGAGALLERYEAARRGREARRPAEPLEAEVSRLERRLDERRAEIDALLGHRVAIDAGVETDSGAAVAAGGPGADRAGERGGDTVDRRGGFVERDGGDDDARVPAGASGADSTPGHADDVANRRGRAAQADGGDDAPPSTAAAGVDPAAAAASIRRRVELDRRGAALDAEIERVAGEAARERAALETWRAMAAGILADAGLALEGPIAGALPAAEAAAARAARLELLERELLPRAASRVLDPATREALEREAERLAVGGSHAGGESATREAERLGSHAGSESAAVERARLEATIARRRSEIEERSRRREELRARYEDQARRCGEEHDEKSAALETTARALSRARRYRAALDLARETLAEVAWDTHRRWAGFLNQRVGELLKTLGAEIGEVRFGEDLDFSVRLPNGASTPRGRARLQLSAGAHDQLHFAVRLAICEFLSRGRAPLPLLVDDAFATSDDARAAAGMRLLIAGLTAGHQIVVVTCHRNRCRALAEADPDLYRRRVQWLDLGSRIPDPLPR